MPTAHTFTAVIEAADRGGAYVTVPFDVEAAFGQKRPKISATFDGAPYRGTLVRMGGDHHILIILKDIRAAIGKDVGDEVTVVVVEDTIPRTVDVPSDLQKALEGHPQAAAFFDGLAYTHRKEYVQWVTVAKRAETRVRRIEKAVAMLAEGKRGR